MADKTILIVDDLPDMRTLIRVTLEEIGARVLEAGDIATAQTLLHAHHPDLALLDMMVQEDLDGYRLCQSIKLDPELQQTRVLMLSARGQMNEVMTGFEAGADDYLIKPFSTQDLLERVRRLLTQQNCPL
ncbi:MAG: response regulator [Steroidobacteraceae bacterium]